MVHGQRPWFQSVMMNCECRTKTPDQDRIWQWTSILAPHSAFIVLNFFLLAIYYPNRYKPRPWYLIFVSVRWFGSSFSRGPSAVLSCISARG